METLVVNIAACLTLAVVLGTDVFFTVVGRPALARSSAPAVLEVMAHLHAVADRRMPLFGGAALVGTVLLVAFGASARAPAAISLVAQLFWLALYLRVAKPINAQMIATTRSGTAAPDARALQTRWESILVPRSILLGIALCMLLLALTNE